MVRCLAFMLLILSSFSVLAQSFAPPLNIPLVLSGTFCELRSNHFHAGIDIKTQQREGLAVFAIEDGNIVRIKVSPYGYGKVLYVAHPEQGLMSVYAHLSSFGPEVDHFMDSMRLAKKQNILDYSFPAGSGIAVARGEEIAKSGNTGGSLAPHLHFEMRTLSNQHPINPQLYFPISDSKRPTIQALMVADMMGDEYGCISERRIYPIEQEGSTLRLPNTLEVSQHSGFAIQVYDQLDAAANKNGAQKYMLSIDEEIVHSYHLDRFSYTQSRYINAMIDYEWYREKRQRFVKLWSDKGMKLRMVETPGKFGLHKYLDGKVHTANILIEDFSGNKNTLVFDFEVLDSEKIPCEQLLYSGKESEVSWGEWTLRSRTPDLFGDLCFDQAMLYGKDTIKIERSFLPVFKPLRWTFPVPEEWRVNYEKNICLAQRTKKGLYYHKAKPAQSGSKKYSASCRDFGTFYPVLDTIAPIITLPYLKEGMDASQHDRISIDVSEFGAGISSVSATLNGKWVLLDLDAGKGRYYHYFLGKAKGIHTLKVRAIDLCGNTTELTRRFKRNR